MLGYARHLEFAGMAGEEQEAPKARSRYFAKCNVCRIASRARKSRYCKPCGALVEIADWSDSAVEAIQNIHATYRERTVGR